MQVSISRQRKVEIVSDVDMYNCQKELLN